MELKDEIERKYLLFEEDSNYATTEFYKIFDSKDVFLNFMNEKSILINQGYLTKQYGYEIMKLMDQEKMIQKNFVEFRLRNKDSIYVFTAKGNGNLSRLELEFKISEKIFNLFWDKTYGKRIIKKRSIIKLEGLIYEFDIYENRDLTIVEVELPNIHTQPIKLGYDITSNKNYKNLLLAS